MDEDEVVMYIIVNSDLKMGKGKIAAQVGHVVMFLMYNLCHGILFPGTTMSLYTRWLGNSYPKIILKADLKTILSINHNYDGNILISDEGRTEVPRGSVTVMGFYPMRRWEAPDEIKELKLL